MNHITLMADTHCRTFDIEPTEILIHAGDFCNAGTTSEMRAQIEWLATLPAEHKVVIAGNHDLCLAYPGGLEAMLSLFEKYGITYLEDSGCEAMGYKIWGSPYSPTFGHWAFMEDDVALFDRFSRIPDDVDILIVHGPPYGLGDYMPRGEHVGSRALLGEIARIRPCLSVHGHIHECAGRWRHAHGGSCVNASCGPRTVWESHNGQLFRTQAWGSPVVLSKGDMR